MWKVKFTCILDKILYYSICLYALTFCFALPLHFDKAAIGLAIIRICLQTNNVQIRKKHLFFIGVFLIALLPSVFFNDVNSEYIFGLNEYRGRFLGPLILLLIILTIRFSKEQIKQFVLLACVSLFINDFFVIWQGILGDSRPAGMAGSYMFFGGVVLLLLPIVIIALLEQEILTNKVFRMISHIMVATTIVAAAYNGTRIVWIGLALIILFSLVVLVKSRKKCIIYLVAAGLVCGTLFMHNQVLSQRWNTITDSNFQSNAERVLMWQSAWHMFKDHPVFGVGIGNYEDQFQQKYKSEKSIEEGQVHPHNVFLSILTQSGILGGIAYLTMFSYLVYESYNAWYRKQNKYALMFFVLTIGYLINGLTDCVFGGPYLKQLNEFYWFLLGCYLILSDYVQIQACGRVK
jgi:O-antigen ligase